MVAKGRNKDPPRGGEEGLKSGSESSPHHFTPHYFTSPCPAVTEGKIMAGKMMGNSDARHFKPGLLSVEVACLMPGVFFLVFFDWRDYPTAIIMSRERLY